MERGSPEKKIPAQAVSEKKYSCKLKIPYPPPPHHFSNGPSLNVYRSGSAERVFDVSSVTKKTHTNQRPKLLELIPVFLAWSMPRSISTPPWTGCKSIVGLRPSSTSPVPIYTPGRRKTKWSKVPCLWKQRDRRGLKPGPPDPGFELEVLTSLH